MVANKAHSSAVPDRTYRKELEYLYARRSAIDTLIESLEEYNRFRSARAAPQDRKTA